MSADARPKLCALVVSALVAAFVAACGPTRLYSGPARPPEEVAILEADNRSLILKIAGRDNRGRSYALLPGIYDIEFAYLLKGAEVHPGAADQRFSIPCTVRLEAEAGHRYQIARSKVEMGRSKTTVALTRRAFDFDMTFHDETANRDLGSLVRCR